MPQNFTGTYATTQVLSNPTTQNPATVTGTISVDSTGPGVVALFGSAGYAWTVTNLGTVESIGSLGVGIRLQSGGFVTNGASGSTSGLIQGIQEGIEIEGSAGTVVNFGTIKGTGGTGVAGFGVVVGTSGGIVRNASTGVILGGHAGVRQNGIGFSPPINPLTVVNYGTIEGTGAVASGVAFGGGQVTNAGSGLIRGAYYGIQIFSSAGTVINLGMIESTGVISGGVQLGAGISLFDGGSVTNGASGSTGGLITGVLEGIGVFGSTVTIANFGTISATGTNGTGVSLEAGGLITNAAGASINAVRAAVSLSFFGTTSAAATVVNAGTLMGATGISIGPADTGSNTIVNFGTIIGTGGTAIRLGAGNDLVVFGSDSSLEGVITGFQPGDRFDLPFLTFSASGTVTLDASTHVLQIVENGGTYTINLDPGQSFAGDTFHLSPDASGGTQITETAPTATQWTNSSGGVWTVDGNWSAGVPTSSTDATLGPLSFSFYTVTLTGSGFANSLTIGDTATLSLSTTSGGQPSSLAVQGNLSNAGKLYVDSYFGNTGGSSLTIGGTLSSSNYIQIGSTSLTGQTTVTAAGLANTGYIYLYGGTGTNTNQATLDTLGAAPPVLAGHIDLSGHALLQFSGGGSFTGIANSASLNLHGANAFVGAPGSNSALGGLASNAGVLELDGGAQVQIDGDLINSGTLQVDYYYSVGGSTLAIAGTLGNTGSVYIGDNNYLAAPATLTAGALDNTGTINLVGGTGTNTNQATLDILGAAPSVLAGHINLSGHALLQFAGGGSFASIAPNSNLSLHGASSFVGSPGSNSALGGLASNAGTLEMDSGATVQISGDFRNSNNIYVDASTIGGSGLTIGGVLSNAGYLQIGNSGASAPSTVSATGLILDDTSRIYLYGGTGTTQATLDVAGAAPAVLAGTLDLSGHALVQFSGGSFASIGQNAALNLHGANAFVGGPGSNSALGGLERNAGTFGLDNGATVQISGDFANFGTLKIDYYYSTGGSTLAIVGTLTNTSSVYIGDNNYLFASATLSAGGLDNTGTITLNGGTGTNTNQAILDVSSGTAPSLLLGDLDLYGHALVEFGGGQITGIASGGRITLGGASAFIADVPDTGSNSALGGLASNAGSLQLDGGAAVHLLGDFANSGIVTLNSYNYGSSGSTLTIDGMLTNTSSLTIGSTYQIAATTVSAASFFNTGSVYLYGGTGTNTNQATLDIASGAAPTVLTGNFYLSGHALLEFAGGSITDIAGNSTLSVNGGNAFVADASDTASNSALGGLARNAGTLELVGGATVHILSDFANFGTLEVDDYYSPGGSTLTIDGTLTNTGSLRIGDNNYLSASATMSAGALANAGYIQIYGGTGSNTNQATLDITGSVTDSGTISLYGNAVLSAGSMTIANGGSVSVTAGATIGATTIANGGTEIVSSGGTSIAPTIAGGVLRLAGGMVTGGGIAFTGTGGTLRIDSNTMPTNTVSGFAPGDAIDLRALTFGSTTSATFDPTSGTLTVTNGGVSDTLNLFGVASGTLFAVANDGFGGTVVTELPLSGGTQWNNPAGGAWTDSGGWSGGVPQATTDATIGVAGSYAVSLTTLGAAKSLTLDHTGAGLVIATSSGSVASASLAIQGDLLNGGGIYIDTVNGQGGSTLSIGGTLTTTNYVKIGDRLQSVATTVGAAAIANRGTLDLAGGSTAGPTLTTTDGFTNTAYVYVDASSGQGGSTLNIGGTLTNTNLLEIGNSTLAATTAVTADALANTGSIYLTGGGGTNTNEAILDVTAAAPSVLSGRFYLSGHSLLEFAGGSIASIANGGSVTLVGGDAFVANATGLGSNSALAGLASNAGTLDLEGGATVHTAGGFANFSAVAVNSSNFGSGGSTLAIDGTLTNTGNLYIGAYYQSAASTVSAFDLANTGYINLTGGSGTNTNQATLSIAAAAPSVLTGRFYLSGHSLLEFASGSIARIANGGSVTLVGGDGFVANAAGLGGNSALAGLESNAGTLDLEGGATVHTAGGFANFSTVTVNSSNFGSAGSTLAVDGTLTNTGNLYIGAYYQSAATTVSVVDLVNTGYINLTGGSGTNTNQATLNIGAAAPSVLTGYFYLSGHSLLEFTGSGTVASIANGGSVTLIGGDAFIANAAGPGSNSALSGLASNAGSLDLEAGASVHTSGGFANFGNLTVNSNFGGGTSSTLTVDGTLTNTNSLSVGAYYQSAATTVSAFDLVNTGNIYLYGGGGTNTNQTTLNVGAAAPSVLTGYFYLSGHSLLEYASGTVAGIANGGSVNLVGGDAFIANASGLGSNNVLSGLASNAGSLNLTGGAAVHTSGGFANFGNVTVNSSNIGSGSSTLIVDGTVTNTNSFSVGAYYQSAATTVSAFDLVNTGNIYLYGGGGTNTNQTILNVGAAAPSVLTGYFYLSGHSLLEYASGTVAGIANGGSVNLVGGDAFVANATGLGSNSALAGLASNAGSLTLTGGASVHIAADFANFGNVTVNTSNVGSGGSSLAVDGMLTNTGSLSIGAYYQSAVTTVSAFNLENANTGAIYLYGGSGTNTNQAILDVAGAMTDGGTIYVSGHALLSAGLLTITSGGSLYLSSGGTAAGAVVGSGGLEYVYSGGVSTSATIAGGTLELAGGTVTAATIAFTARGGTLRIDGTAMPGNTITGFRSHQTIDLRGVGGGSSGTASITSGNALVVNEGGTSYTLQLDPSGNYSGATVNLASDGAGGTVVTLTIPPLIVSSGQSVTVSAGEIEDNIEILSGGLLTVLSGGTVNDTIDGGSEILSGGLDFNGTVTSGGIMLVSSGGVASITNVATLGQMTVLSGGSATDATVTGGGIIFVQSGGITISSVVVGNEGGSGTVPSSEILLGGFAVATTVSGGGALFVSSGGHELGGSIGGAGVEAVFLGGTASATTVSTGGELDVSAGATAIDLVVLTGGDIEVSGGTVSGTTVNSGGRQHINAGTAIGTIVNGGGKETVSAGATASGTTVNGGTQNVRGSALATIVNNLGFEIVASGGVASGTTVNSGGIIMLAGGAVDSGTALNPGAALAVIDGYVLNLYVVSGGRILDVGAGTFGVSLGFATASALATTVASGGVENVQSGGIASGTVVNSGGTENLLAGGIAIGTILNGGASETINSGGVTVGTILNAGASETINSGGVASGTTLSGGTETIFFGGVASGSVLNAAAMQLVFGVASDTIVSATDSQIVESGGAALGTVVSSGGSEIVLSAGLTSDTTIAGGIVELRDGAVASGTTVFVGGGGVLQIDGATMPTNTIGGFAPGDTIDLRSVAGGGAGSVTLGAGNVLTVSEGGSAYTLQLDPSQNFAALRFALADDSFGGTAIRVVSGGVVGPGEVLVLSAGQSVSGITVLSGGTLIVGAGATLIGGEVFGGGTVSVGSGGVASGTVVLSGGSEIVQLGGVDVAAVISGGGFEDVFGSATGTLIFGGGSQTVEAGGSAEGTVLDDAAVQIVSGFAGGTVVSATDLQIVESGGVASGTIVSSGGSELVHSGGVASHTTVSGGGSELVFSGGLTIDTTIAGGFVELMAGAVASGTTSFIATGGPGGVLRIDGPSMPAGPIAGFARGDAIDLRGLGFSSGNSVSFDAGTGALHVSGGVVDTLSLIGVAPGTAFALSDDGQGGTAVREVPPAPSGLALLSPQSDSGILGDNLTNDTTPVITGSGEAGDTVLLFADGVFTGQSTIVAPSGGWILAPALGPGVHVLTATQSDGAAVSAPSAGLTLTIDTSAPQTAPVSASFAFDGGPRPIGIAAPGDVDNPAGSLAIKVVGLPGNGTVTLADGVTPVTVGEALTIGQLSGLLFAPAPDQLGVSDSFSYTVTDPADNAATGGARLTVTASATVSVFDFVFTYNDGNDYYYGKVADNGTFGYHVGQQLLFGAGQYIVFDRAADPAPVAAGSVFVTNYSHGGPGAATTTPDKTAAGEADGTNGLGSERDAVRGTDGQPHGFSSASAASFATNALFGFVFSYADGAAFYTGTVAVAPGGTPAIPSSGGLLGSYSVFAAGVSARVAGTVVIDRFTAGGASYIPAGAGAGGLGSEAGSISVNGTSFSFSDQAEPVIPSGIAVVPVDPAPDPNDVVTSILTEIYREVLDRPVDPSGLATYGAALVGGGSAASVRQQIAASDEARDLLQGLYHQIFGRDADPGGLATYRSALANGSSLTAVRLILGQSAEAQDHIGQLYQEVLGRPADGGGLATYMAGLANGASLAGVRGILAHSLEAASDLVPLFQDILGRPPGAAELIGMEDLLAGGATQESLRSALTGTGSAGGFTTILAQIGDETLTAPPGVPTLFVFGDIAFGNDTIAGFDAVRDTIGLPHAIVADQAALNDHITPFGAGTLIALTPSHSIQLTNLAPASLTPANFLIL